MWTAICSPRCRWRAQSSTLSSLVTLTTPGVAADSNGLFHGLGDHASNSFSVDGQSITDQQSKVFSNQIPANSIQSIEVISGAPPAEYGGKTSLVIVATTRSGQGITKPTGSVNSSYGAFGSATAGFDLAYGGKNWGNFIEADGLNSGRFLDPPEFTVFHDKGNEQNIFDRVDYSLHAGRFHAPGPELQPLLVPDAQHLRQPQRPERDQRTAPAPAPSSATSATPTSTPRSGPSTSRPLTRASSATTRSSTSARLCAGTTTTTTPAAIPWPTWARQPADFIHLRSTAPSPTPPSTRDFSYVKGIHNIKVGAQYGQTFLSENDSLGVVECHLQLALRGRERQPAARLLRSLALATAWFRSRIPTTLPSLRPTTLPAAEATTTSPATPT